MSKLPIVAVTIGEVSGIGPEIAVKALTDAEIFEVCRPILVGDGKVLERACQSFKIDIRFNKISRPEDAKWEGEAVNLIDLDNVPLSQLTPGKHNATTGRAMLDYTDKLIEFYKDGSIHGGVGGPHSKKAADEAGYNFVGYPYYIADMIGAPDPFMMLVAGKMRAVNTTLHVSLRRAIEMIDRELVFKAILAGENAVKLFGVENPKIAVAGLNPHSGEEGMFGTEEVEHIQPAIKAAQNKGIDVIGPVPADALFYQCNSDPKYDVYIGMYHDQVHIPVKVESFFAASAVAIGIPYIFATVDHGCAPDIAWQGVANAGVLKYTIKLIAEMAKHKFNL